MQINVAFFLQVPLFFFFGLLLLSWQLLPKLIKENLIDQHSAKGFEFPDGDDAWWSCDKEAAKETLRK